MLVKNVKETAKLCNCSTASVKKILDIYGITKEVRIENSIIFNKTKFGRPVAKIDKETNKIIAIYENMTVAAKNNPKAHRAHIGRVCRGERKTAGGYKWQYI